MVKPRFVSVERFIPDAIMKPKYFYEYQPPDMFSSESAEIKMEIKISKMRDSCRLAANILEKCSKLIQVGVFTFNFFPHTHIKKNCFFFIAWNNNR